jgi:hypothetical protein
MTELPKRIAYCAPGRESLVALILAYHDVDFDTVRGSAIMAGRDDIIIASHDPVIDELDAQVTALRELRDKTEGSTESVRRFFRDYAANPPPAGSSFRILSGI